MARVMDGTEAEPRVTIESQNGTAGHADHRVQRAAEAAAAAARALTDAGYEPRQLSVTYAEDGELLLTARLDDNRVLTVPAPAIEAPSADGGRPSTIWVRVAVGLTLGLILGFLGLPRLELPDLRPQPEPAPPAVAPTSAPPEIISVRDLATPETSFAPPAPQPPAAAPTPTPLPPAPTPTPIASRVLFDRPLTATLPGWPDDPQGTAWFENGEYRLMARDSGRFVATGVPLDEPVEDVRLSATFRKMGGPAGGGYGLIVRDQDSPADLDGHTQDGDFLVLEVGDRGDFGIWRRNQSRWVDVVPWRHSDAVHVDQQSNEVVVTSRGNALQFAVNGQMLAELSYDKLPSSGGLGIFVGGDLNEVALESLRIENV